MARITINDNITVNGKLTFRRTLVIKKDANGNEMPSFEIEGVLATHLYFEQIRSLQTPRFRIDGVQVYEEDFGSDDYNILYHFTADVIDILGVEKDGITICLYSEEMKQIEDEMYKNDHPILGDIGEQYKDMYERDEDDEEEEDKEE